MTPLRWTEWLELVWRALLIGLLIWFGMVLRDFGRLRAKDVETAAWAWAQNQQQQSEQNRLLRAICLSTVTIYDAARGVCDAAGGVEMEKPELPKLKGGPYPRPHR